MHKNLLNQCKKLLGAQFREEVKNYVLKIQNVKIWMWGRGTGMKQLFLSHNRNLHYEKRRNPLEKEKKKNGWIDVRVYLQTLTDLAGICSTSGYQ